MNKQYRLTQYSRAGGCGCKISPAVLEKILSDSNVSRSDSNLWVGNESRDDAAVFGLDAERGIVTSTDFFTPIVDDPFDFGRIAAANAISDIYAMGGEPLVAIAILGWPINDLPPEVAQQVIWGGRSMCAEAGISLAGGHSIDSLEPIFGLCVTGTVHRKFMKRNNTAEEGCRIYLSKPLGVGVLATAEKLGLLRSVDQGTACDLMCQLNSAGVRFGRLDCVKAMTDVTGFGLLGHLIEMAEGSRLTARIKYSAVPRLECIEYYLRKGCLPSGARRNYESYGSRVTPFLDGENLLMCDPQTNGGLLIAVDENSEGDFVVEAGILGLNLSFIGEFIAQGEHAVEVV
jgi:selenide,water dikinase